MLFPLALRALAVFNSMIHPMYVDFFKFLDSKENGDPWRAYERLYLRPHETFLLAYWRKFDHFDREQIAQRVRQIKKEDYGSLRSLLQAQNPALLADGALERCGKVFPLEPPPPVYLF